MYVKRFLYKLSGLLSYQEKSLLEDYTKGNILCNTSDGLPNMKLSPSLVECGHTSPLLVLGECDQMYLDSVTGKVIYKNLVKVANRATLKGRMDTVWRDKLGIDDKTKPVWRFEVSIDKENW